MYEYELISDVGSYLTGQADAMYGYARRNTNEHYIKGFGSNYEISESNFRIESNPTKAKELILEKVSYHHAAIDTALAALNCDPIFNQCPDDIAELTACYMATLHSLERIRLQVKKAVT